MEKLFTLSVMVAVVTIIVAWCRISHWTQRAMKLEAALEKIEHEIYPAEVRIRDYDPATGFLDIGEVRAMERRSGPSKEGK